MIGFSSISTGVCTSPNLLKENQRGERANEEIDGYPIKDATHIALETTRQFLEQDNTVRLVLTHPPT